MWSIQSESVLILGGGAAWSAGGVGLALVGSVVGVLADRMEGKVCIMCGWSQCGPYMEGSSVGVFVGRAWFCQLLKWSRGLAIAFSRLLQEMLDASWRASVRMRSL